MTAKYATSRTLAAALCLAAALPALAEEPVVVEGIDLSTGKPAGQEVPVVQDLGDGNENAGGPPDMTVNLREAALEDEPNIGPNAPGYIPGSAGGDD